MSSRRNTPPDGDPSRPDLESTADLLARLRAGDDTAAARLFNRYLPKLERLLRRWLPRRKRDPMKDTADFVQDTWARALKRLGEGGFEYRHEGSFLLYLRRILYNLVRDEGPPPPPSPGSDAQASDPVDAAPSPLVQAIGRQKWERFERALAKLKEDDQAAIVLRFELGYTYPELAGALKIDNPHTAGMRVKRAIIKLQKHMDDDD